MLQSFLIYYRYIVLKAHFIFHNLTPNWDSRYSIRQYRRITCVWTRTEIWKLSKHLKRIFLTYFRDTLIFILCIVSHKCLPFRSKIIIKNFKTTVSELSERRWKNCLFCKIPLKILLKKNLLFNKLCFVYFISYSISNVSSVSEYIG